MTLSGNSLQCGPIIPEFIMRMKGIKPGAKTLYAVLVRSCAFKDHCWPSQAYLSKAIGQCVRSVQNYLRELVDAGLIGITMGRYGNVYQLLPHPTVMNELKSRFAKSKRHSPAPANASPAAKCAKVACRINSKKEQENTPISPLSEADAAFSEVWRIWPVQEARKSALRSWRRLWRSALLPKLDALLACVKAHLAHNPRWKRGFVPHLAAWLKGRRWEDQLTATVQASEPVSQVAEKAVRHEEEGETANRAVEFNCDDLPGIETVFSVLPVEMNNTQKSSIRGVWKHLMMQGRLPSFESIVEATKGISSVRDLQRWLLCQVTNE